jgi:NurA domain
MLDFNKLMQQIDQVGQESLSESLDEHETLLNAHEAFDAARDNDDLLNRLRDNQATVMWPVALPLERFGNSYSIEPQPAAVTVVGIDGSQIMPSHHEVHACYLLNIGVAMITYGDKHPPVLESVPRLYHRPEDLYPLVDRRRFHIDELYISLERTLLELQVLLERAIQAQERGAPVVALFDGSLITWSVEKLPETHQINYNERLMTTLEGFKTQRIPVLGYLSHSRSSDLVNVLRVAICPYEKSRCREYCGHLNEEDFPCSRVWPISDRQVLHGKLDHGQRSCAFISNSSATKTLPPAHKICFAYLNTGYEIARIEFPQWLFAEGELLKLGFSVAMAQSKKGMGYPICLSEAHHLAVVRGRDRERFFDLMTQHLVGLGVRRVRVSPKESKKRSGFV